MALSDIGVSCWSKREAQGDDERVFCSILGALGMNGVFLLSQLTPGETCLPHTTVMMERGMMGLVRWLSG